MIRGLGIKVIGLFPRLANPVVIRWDGRECQRSGAPGLIGNLFAGFRVPTTAGPDYPAQRKYQKRKFTCSP